VKRDTRKERKPKKEKGNQKGVGRRKETRRFALLLKLSRIG
jgi:hypothetical protein